ncbi:valine--tRNA ligase [Helicobacter sp. 12S02634-8]|uniref:valine--tRNA ligase n=1 Tax=Helicobacter sp. 12S02634-8 TaxID=1476199 RepID=UPI000BA65B93|nr:valine--tRNA ligase [Helicobacter sp. 12S02634-8]PAF47555.1 valine--tRNA ligase [Helicobacter sp. 12S02634-8]
MSLDSELTSYNPKAIEEAIYKICKERDYFEITGNQSIQKEGKTFAIMMPPPNVTGVLHIGHALTLTLQDILTRYKRMDGYKTLYQPGLDHAGIATQNIVEKQLLAMGIKKEDIGREAFIQKVWEWKEKSGGKIFEQMERLGISPAWSRSRFTMDDGLKNAVKEAFVTWYNQGLIIQDNYMVNWCTHDGALSDIEVEYEENQGKLYYLKYPIKGTNENLIVATTRPETYFGDMAVMVNPDDVRYQKLIGQKVSLPLLDREIPIIADSYVDASFGTGCVKVTPAHDLNDYEVAKRHGLDFLVVFNKNGILNDLAQEFKGLERLEAREAIVAKLESAGFIEKIQDYTNQIGKCYRCGNTIEPYISKQWFVKAEVATQAIQKVNEDLLTFYPAQWKNNYNAWMRELKSWCISRQLWWGHRIPVWTCVCGHTFASTQDTPTCPQCGSDNLTQDPDVLDTWFSSGLWAFSTLGWGNGKAGEGSKWQADDLKDFYPNSALITGFDILFFWVARMLLSGESLLGALPFKDVYLHALVRDENGQKMSKSKGNVIDPLEMIEKYGADALRFALAMLCVQGRDIRLSVSVIELAKNFANKLFNALNFLMLYTDSQEKNQGTHRGFESKGGLENYQTPLGRYAKSRLNLATKEVRHALETYRFNDGANILYRFLWGEFCDWFIELAKADKLAVYELGSVFKEACKLLHPYMPFLSDYLYHKLEGTSIQNAPSVMVLPYPSQTLQDMSIETEFETIKDVIVSIRRAKMLLDIGNKEIPQVTIELNEGRECDSILLQRFATKLAKVERIEIATAKPPCCVSDVGLYCQSHLSLLGIDLSQIIKRLQSQKQKLEKEISKLQSMLTNEKFIQNAPHAVLTEAKKNLEEAQNRMIQVNQSLEDMQNIQA